MTNSEQVMVEPEKTFILLLELSTAQNYMHGIVGTQTLERQLVNVAAQFGFTAIRSFGDAMLFLGFAVSDQNSDTARPIEFFGALRDESRKWLGNLPSHPHFRCALHYGFCSVTRSDTGIVEAFGADLVLPFRLMKHAEPDALLVTEEAWDQLSEVVEAAGIRSRIGSITFTRSFGPVEKFMEDLGLSESILESDSGKTLRIRMVSVPLTDSAPRTQVQSQIISSSSVSVKLSAPLQHTARQMDGILQRYGSVRQFFEMVRRSFPSIDGLQLTEALRGRVLPLSSLFAAVRANLVGFRGSREEFAALRELVGGMLVFGLRPAWLARAAEARSTFLEVPVASQFLRLGHRTVNLLHVVSRAFADGNAELDVAFGSPSADKLCIGSLPHIAIRRTDAIEDIKRHFIRVVLSAEVDTSTPERLDNLFDVVKRVMRESFHQSHAPFYGTSHAFRSQLETVRQVLRLEDLLLLFPSGDADPRDEMFEDQGEMFNCAGDIHEILSKADLTAPQPIERARRAEVALPLVIQAQAPSLLLIPQFPPRWAEVFGEDRRGIFAECSVEGVRFVWRWIPPGRFLMGSPEDEVGRQEREGPQHEVTISRGFWLGETPVTQAQWMALVGEDPSGFKGQPQRPVEQVSWHDAVAFCQGLALRWPTLHPRLPTEAEWEYACRAGTQGAFHDGSPCTKPNGKDPALDRLGWFYENSGNETKPVRGKAPNAWGLYDLHGNVWEWCADGFREYRERGEVDPLGPVDGPARVVRGGAWDDPARFCRAAFRSWLVPGSRRDFLGFRLAAGQELTESEPRAAEPPGAERPRPTEGRGRAARGKEEG